MESMSGGFVRVLSEAEDKIDIGQKINVLHDIMQDEAFEAALEFQINDDDKKDDMIRMVPTPKLDSNFNINSDLDPNHSLEQVIHNIDTTFTDFDLSFLPKTEGDCNLDVDLGSPASSLVELSSLSPPSPSDQACLSPCLVTDLDYSGSSLTMFSSGAGSPFDPKKSNMLNQSSYPGYQMESPPRYVPSASPLSQAPSSPYSPGLRPMIRFSSTESERTNSSSSINLKEDLSELAELQQQTAAAQQSPPSVLRRALVDGSLKLYPGGEFVSTAEDHSMITDSKNDDSFEEDPKLESVLSLVMDHLDMDPLEHVRKEIQSQCSVWNINADPQCWSQRDVVIWMRAKMQEFKIPNDSQIRAMEWLAAANIDGPGFVQIPEEEFKARLPEGGEKLYNTLGLWKNTASCYNPTNSMNFSDPINVSCQPQDNEMYIGVDEALGIIENDQQQYTLPLPPPYKEAIRGRPATQQAPQAATFEAPPSLLPSLVAKMPPLVDLLAEPQLQQQQQQQPPPPYPISPHPTLPSETVVTSPISTDDQEDEDGPDLPLSPMSPSKSGPIRGSSSNIHLWQFVKDLLNQPQHSGAIHWVDQAQGIFKIVDSVRVAELWGKRKNRPAMNFDKLSRSLRQYYKKGIMKKTSRPQRLVYQFCTPYHL